VRKNGATAANHDKHRASRPLDSSDRRTGARRSGKSKENTMTQNKSAMRALGLAIFLSAAATMPSVAAAPMSNAAALRTAVPDDVTEVRQRSRRGWRRAYGYQPFGRAYGYSRGRASGHGCLGGRDGSGVPC
jgi:hypothetical protein